MSTNPLTLKLTVLIAARRNSKYLAKFIMALSNKTHGSFYTQVLVIMNEHDTWNDDLVQFMEFAYPGRIKFIRENLQLGRAGLHQYFNMLLPYADGDWLIYFCEDHYVQQPGWDDLLLDYLMGLKKSGDSEGKRFPLDPAEPWVLVPKFDNCGAMNHIVSRGFIRALKGKIGNHGWIDSYINDLMRPFPDRVIRIDEEWFHDFTHDQPSPMHDSHLQTVLSEKGKALPKYDSTVVRHRILLDQEKLTRAIKEAYHE